MSIIWPKEGKERGKERGKEKGKKRRGRRKERREEKRGGRGKNNPRYLKKKFFFKCLEVLFRTISQKKSENIKRFVQPHELFDAAPAASAWCAKNFKNKIAKGSKSTLSGFFLVFFREINSRKIHKHPIAQKFLW